MSTTNDDLEPADAAAVDTLEPAPRRKRWLLIGGAIALTLTLVAGGVVAVATVQSQQAAQAQADSAAAAAAATAAELAEALDEATAMATTVQKVLDVLTDAEGEPVIDVDLSGLDEAQLALKSDHADRDAAHSATFATIRQLDLVLRSVSATVHTARASVSLAGDSEQENFDKALAALVAAPYGVPSSYVDRDVLIATVLQASAAARESHDKSAIVAGAPTSDAGTTSGGGSSGGTTSGGNTYGGATSGGGSSGGGTTAPPPAPAPHPRAALCESLGFGANGASCLANTPTYVTTNAAYVPLASCVDPGAYGSHTPGFGGTSSPSYTFPWSYRIDYASSGLGTVKFFVCG